MRAQALSLLSSLDGDKTQEKRNRLSLLYTSCQIGEAPALEVQRTNLGFLSWSMTKALNEQWGKRVERWRLTSSIQVASPGSLCGLVFTETT